MLAGRFLDLRLGFGFFIIALDRSRRRRTFNLELLCPIRLKCAESLADCVSLPEYSNSSSSSKAPGALTAIRWSSGVFPVSPSDSLASKTCSSCMLSCLFNTLKPEKVLIVFRFVAAGVVGVVGGLGTFDFSKNCCPLMDSRFQDFHHWFLVLLLTCEPDVAEASSSFLVSVLLEGAMLFCQVWDSLGFFFASRFLLEENELVGSLRSIVFRGISDTLRLDRLECGRTGDLERESEGGELERDRPLRFTL